jgi:hypothetical protein
LPVNSLRSPRCSSFSKRYSMLALIAIRLTRMIKHHRTKVLHRSKQENHGLPLGSHATSAGVCGTRWSSSCKSCRTCGCARSRTARSSASGSPLPGSAGMVRCGCCDPWDGVTACFVHTWTHRADDLPKQSSGVRHGHTHARHHIMVSMDNFRTDPSMDVELQYILPA